MTGRHWTAALVLVPMLCACATTRSREDATEYSSGSWRHETVEAEGREYPVGVWIPDGWRGPGRGLVFLHGSGECGSDGEKQLTVGLPPAIEAEPERWPFVVICPQKPTVESAWEDHSAAVFAALDEAIDEGLIDPERVAITGLSQGGHGTMQIAGRHPERFRAAAPICGYIAGGAHHSRELWTDPEDAAVQRLADGLATLPVWIFAGDADPVVPPAESRELARLLRERDADVQLTIFPGLGHNAWDAAYRQTELSSWLVEHTR